MFLLAAEKGVATPSSQLQLPAFSKRAVVVLTHIWLFGTRGLPATSAGSPRFYLLPLGLRNCCGLPHDDWRNGY